MTKTCNCDVKSALYNDLGIYKCQYCMGVCKDLPRVRLYIDSNIVSSPNKDKEAAEKLRPHREFVDKLTYGWSVSNQS